MTIELGIVYDERVKGHIPIVKSDEHLCLENFIVVASLSASNLATHDPV